MRTTRNGSQFGTHGKEGRKGQGIERLRVLGVCPTLYDDPTETLQSLQEQSVKPSRTIIAVGSRELFENLRTQFECIYAKPREEDSFGIRIARALNSVLDTVDLNDFDYIIRVDADVILPANFIEASVALRADIVGEFGDAMLIAIRAFRKHLEGRFPLTIAEDTYTAYKLKSVGCRLADWSVVPIVKRTPGKGKPWSFFCARGIEMYKLGFEPFHVVASLLLDIRNSFAISTYFISLLRHRGKYEFADRIFVWKTKSLMQDVRRAICGKKTLKVGLRQGLDGE